ncbi:unnamed protein product [Blepharisma stoltei]|uniref:Uncharacterized protein n=1 Tax=Blepharisma stoltei TaxID=1481888 RepID=A0AAU9IJU7_9CILI|nr:unnamed protein product [Blepharisma stoltei]
MQRRICSIEIAEMTLEFTFFNSKFYMAYFYSLHNIYWLVKWYYTSSSLFNFFIIINIMGAGCTNISRPKEKKVQNNSSAPPKSEVEAALDRLAKNTSSQNAETHEYQVHPLQKIFDTKECEMNRKLIGLYTKAIYEQKLNVDQINLSFSNLGITGAQHLCHLLPFAGKVKILKLWKTQLGAAGIKLLAPALPLLKNLMILSLEDNAIKTEGCCYLAQALYEMNSLEELWLHINAIGPEGVAFIGKALKNVKGLKKLGLDENDIQNKGLADFAGNLKEMENLEVLGLAFNFITNESQNEIIDALKGKKITVNLSGNHIDEDTKTRFISELPEATFTY